MLSSLPATIFPDDDEPGFVDAAAPMQRWIGNSTPEVLTRSRFNSAEISALTFVWLFSLCPWCLCGEVLVAAGPRYAFVVNHPP